MCVNWNQEVRSQPQINNYTKYSQHPLQGLLFEQHSDHDISVGSFYARISIADYSVNKTFLCLIFCSMIKLSCFSFYPLSLVCVCYWQRIWNHENKQVCFKLIPLYCHIKFKQYTWMHNFSNPSMQYLVCHTRTLDNILYN
jgi:hypothetical protein